MKNLALILSLVSCTAPAAPQTVASTQPSPGIFGRVLNAETRAAVRLVAIKVYTSKEQWDTFTDAEGRFKFPALAPGEYALVTHRDGYTDRAYKIERSDFDHHNELPIELHRQAVIAGKVVDGDGQPLQSAQIQALALRTRGGKIEVVDSAVTNDLGEYRLFGLDPGAYRLRVSYREGGSSEFDTSPLRLATSYYGGSEKNAEMTVKAASVVDGIDFILNPARPATIRGTLHSPSGVLTEHAALWIIGQRGEGGHSGQADNGKFEIADLGPGTYTISAKTSSKAAPLFGSTTVEVHSGDIAVEITLRPIPIVNGEIRLQGRAFADLTRGSISFTPTVPTMIPLNLELAKPDKDGRFTVALIPGEYKLTFDSSVRDLGVESVTLDDKEIIGWTMQIGESAETKRLVIVLGAKP